MKHIFISRDLRDILVSYVYFIVEKYPHHPLYEYLTNDVKNQKQRYLALVNGVQTGKTSYPSIAEWFQPYKGWIKDPDTLSITFEDLVQSKESSISVLNKIIDYLWKGPPPLCPDPIWLNSWGGK